MNKITFSPSIFTLKEIQLKTPKNRKVESTTAFQSVLETCHEENLTEQDIEFLIELYNKTKELYVRNTILKILVWYEQCNLKDFFLQAFSKERYLDMRLWAIRGYTNYAQEKDVEKVILKFQVTLMKRMQSTPYNYQEYEQIRSVFGLPYLIKRFGYDCFIKAYEQEEIQYNAMPDAFKGYFTLDDKGNHVSLKAREEIDELQNNFFKNNK